jgi:radical SAM superfamily enzyme YgiQ (UPF0313 family)
MAKILIANSVGKDDEGNLYILFPSRWSASVGKFKSFNFYPYELGYLSSLIKRETDNQVKMVDGNYDNLSASEYWEKTKDYKPDWLIMESSSVVYEDDLKFALKFKKEFKTKIVFTGQHVSAYPKEALADGVDYVVVGEYEKAVLELVEGKQKSKIANLYPNKVGELIDINWLPWPEDEDIKRINYGGIGGSEYREIEMFPSRGCPMSCNFCVARQVYYGKPNFRTRKPSDVVAEMKYLANKYSELEGLFFDEEYHNANKLYVMELADEIIKSGMNKLKIEAMCGYWTIDEEMVKKMSEAGYYKLRLGIESVGANTGLGMKKSINVDKMTSALEMLKKYDIKVYGTFTFGAMGSSKAEDEATLKFINDLAKKELIWDFQASICTPQPGTPFYDELVSKGYLLTNDWKQFNGNRAVYEYPDYKKKDIEANLKKVLRIYVGQMVRRKGLIKFGWEILVRDGVRGNIRKVLQYLQP